MMLFPCVKKYVDPNLSQSTVCQLAYGLYKANAMPNI